MVILWLTRQEDNFSVSLFVLFHEFRLDRMTQQNPPTAETNLSSGALAASQLLRNLSYAKELK